MNKSSGITAGRLLFIVSTAILLLSGCTPRTYLMVDYMVLPDSNVLEGQQVRLKINDLRKDMQVLTSAAAREFEGFNGRYSLAWKMPNRDRVLAGEYDLQGLFRETFRKRLENLGVTVVHESDAQAPLFQINLYQLKVDIQRRNWRTAVTYEATLSKDDNLIAKQEIKGSAQRAKIIGRKGADTVLSELYTDMINRLNILRLFEQAKLI
jgi:hypothetical protein